MASDNLPRADSRAVLLIKGGTVHELFDIVRRNTPRVTEGGGVVIDEVTDGGTFLSAVVGCVCPEGLAETYCVPGLNINGDTVLTLQDDCEWCGYTEESVEDRRKVQLVIMENPDAEVGGCGWGLILDDGDFVYWKAWENGNPIGTYDLDGIGTRTVIACGESAGELFPCEAPPP